MAKQRANLSWPGETVLEKTPGGYPEIVFPDPSFPLESPKGHPKTAAVDRGDVATE